MTDRFGIGWRPELAAGILSQTAAWDLIEVIADDYLDCRPQALRALRTLARHVPVTLHGVGLGLASAVAVAEPRLARLARLIHRLEPESWSEHLAFVRGGGTEIGHLAAPPRTAATVAGAVANLARIRQVVGSLPAVENVATLLVPPGSEMDEPAWTGRIVAESGAPMLLDLHNLYANAVNTGQDPAALLMAMPLAAVTTVHVAGGRWVQASTGERRLLDDHRHAVPPAVYALLTDLGSRVRQPLTVILERDGAYPTIDVLIAEVDRARAALAAGRSAQSAGTPR